MKLLSMTDFVLEVKEKCNQSGFKDFSFMSQYQSIFNYAEFLKLPLKLEMFIPLRQDGISIVEPIPNKTSQKRYPYELRDYREAKEKVLFKGFSYKFNIDKDGKKWEYVKNEFPHVFSLDQLKNNTVESLLTRFKKECLIELTESAIKQIFG